MTKQQDVAAILVSSIYHNHHKQPCFPASTISWLFNDWVTKVGVQLIIPTAIIKDQQTQYLLKIYCCPIDVFLYTIHNHIGIIGLLLMANKVQLVPSVYIIAMQKVGMCSFSIRMMAAPDNGLKQPL